MTDIGPYNRFRRKKDMWIEISTQIPNMSPKQCEERLKTILRRKRKGIIEKVYLTAGQKKLLDLYDEEDELHNIGKKGKFSTEEEESMTSSKDIQVWSASETKLLVGLYKTFITEVGPQKKFTHKNDMWAQIAVNLENKDSRQCEQRFNTLFKRKKKCSTKSYASKARRKTNDLRSRHAMETSPLKNNDNDEVVVDEVVMDEDVLKPQATEESIQQVEATPDNADKSERFSISQTLREIAAKKEEGKERRHLERMEAMTNFQNLLLQMLSARKQ